MGGVKTKDTMAYMKSPLEQAKPDYIDIDKDGNTTESMKEASMAKMKSPLEQKFAAESTGITTPNDAEINDAMNSDADLIAQFKENNPEEYEKMMSKWNANTEGGTTSQGTSQQGSTQYNVQPFPIETATGIDWIDNKTSGGRERLRNEKKDAVNSQLLDYIKQRNEMKAASEKRQAEYDAR